MFAARYADNMTMSVLITTVMALVASLLAALAWTSAARHQWRLNQGWEACMWFLRINRAAIGRRANLPLPVSFGTLHSEGVRPCLH